jgi:hypothetical protein
MLYQVKNYNFKHDGKDYLAYAKAHYEVEHDAEVGPEAVFEAVELIEAIGAKGFVPADELKALEDSLLVSLNRDGHLCRVLGSR